MKKYSILETYDIRTKERRVLREFEGLIEAPNWLKDGDTLLYNAGGEIWTYRIPDGRTEKLDTGGCTGCNNDHVPSADGQYLGISCHPPGAPEDVCHICVVPIGGGPSRQVTENSPCFLHGWSHDGTEMAYCAFRGECVDVYSIPAAGGAERRLTDGAGYNDGPEYSPDDRYIWFNSTRDGLMQIYRMNRDGSGLTQMTDRQSNNWFAHVSPDGEKVVYLSFREGDLEPWEHLPDKEVELWLMNADGTDQHRIVSLFGGQGSINVNSWSPDGEKFAFVSYRYE